VALFLGVMASVSLPGTLNFNGEFLVLLNAYPVSALCTILSGLGVIFGAVYMLKFYQQLGLSKKIDIKAETSVIKDLSGYDLILFTVIFAVIIYGGVQPAIFLKGN
jgi:NADH-quinone oxidoreductase subunit M